MSNLHYFDEAGYYTGTTEVPVNPVTGKPFAINESVATLDTLPAYTPEVERARRVSGAWVVEATPLPEPEPEPQPEPDKQTIEQERERARAALNPLRDTFLNRLVGIAVFTPDEAVKVECAELRIALLDITKDQAFLVAETYQDMEIALMSRYRVIASSASIVVRNVFKELEE